MHLSNRCCTHAVIFYSNSFNSYKWTHFTQFGVKYSCMSLPTGTLLYHGLVGSFKWSNKKNVLLEGFLWQLAKAHRGPKHAQGSIHQLEDMWSLGQLCLQCAAFFYIPLLCFETSSMYTYLSGVSSYLWNLDLSHFNTPTKAEHFPHHIKHCILYGSWRSCAHNTTVPQFVLIILCRYSCMLCLSPNFSCVQMVKVGIHCTMQRFKLAVLLIKEIQTFRIYNPQWHVSQNST